MPIPKLCPNGRYGLWPQGQLSASNQAAATASMAAADTVDADSSSRALSSVGGSSVADSKHCADCHRNFPMRLFPAARQSPDGRHSLCYACRSKLYSKRRPRPPRCVARTAGLVIVKYSQRACII